MTDPGGSHGSGAAAPAGTGEAAGRAPPFVVQQFPLFLLVTVGTLVAIGVSPVMRGFFLTPLFWGAPFYIHPFITLSLILFVVFGAILLSGQGDQAWPLYLFPLGLWLLIAFVEYSLIFWFEIQREILTYANRVNPFAFTAGAMAIGAAILLHVNQLKKRLHGELRERGLDGAELALLETEPVKEARLYVLTLVGLVLGASIVLWLTGLVLGRTRLGLDVLGILGGLVITAGLLFYSYQVLKSPTAGDGDGRGDGGTGGSSTPPPTDPSAAGSVPFAGPPEIPLPQRGPHAPPRDGDGTGRLR